MLHLRSINSVVSDSHFDGVPYAITVRADGPRPNILLDNLLVENSTSVVLVSGAETILPGKLDARTNSPLVLEFSLCGIIYDFPYWLSWGLI